MSIGGMAGDRPEREDAMLELELSRSLPSVFLMVSVFGVDQRGAALDVSSPSGPWPAGPVPDGEPLDDAVLEGAELVEIDLRLGELDAPRLRVARLRRSALATWRSAFDGMQPR
ncbi:MAG: hypothetical protein QM736_21060 [Vicinamibacterales bacterium]